MPITKKDREANPWTPFFMIIVLKIKANKMTVYPPTVHPSTALVVEQPSFSVIGFWTTLMMSVPNIPLQYMVIKPRIKMISALILNPFEAFFSNIVKTSDTKYLLYLYSYKNLSRLKLNNPR
jgi:hypothetical protein